MQAAGAVLALLWAAAAWWPVPRTQPEAALAGDEQPPEPGLTEAVVVLHTGREVTGFLIAESAEEVVVRINGIDTTFQRARVAAIRRLAPVPERYAALRAAVDDNDVRARLALVEWLRVRQAYDLALNELEGILAVEPGNPDAKTLHAWLLGHLRLAERSGERQERERPVRPAQGAAPPMPVLSEAEINRIRVFEMDLGTPTRVLISDDTMRRLMTSYPESFPVDLAERDRMLKLDPMAKLRLIFQLRARELYDEVKVMQDPPAMAAFRAKVHSSGGWLVNACASDRCHGGAQAGRLRLVNDKPNSDAAAYTNFVILERARLADGTPLINFDEPGRSPLLHLALPRRSSLYPHPRVDAQALGQDWAFVFRSSSERKFRDAVDWIGSLYQPRPDYGIDYPPAAPPEQEGTIPEEPVLPTEVSPEPASGQAPAHTPPGQPAEPDPTKP